MHIVILTAGSRGDVQPFIALAVGLQAHGYRVTLGAPALFESFVTEYGVTFAPLDDEFLKLSESAKGAAAVEKGRGGFSLIAQVKPMLRRMMDDALRAADTADLIVYHPKVLGAPYIAEARKIPAILALPLPAYTPTAAFANPIIPLNGAHGFINKLTYGVLKLVKAPYLDVINDFRVNSLGLSRTGRFSDDRLFNGAPIPVLYPVSPHVIPEPDDYPPHATMTGYCWLPAPADWTPPADLAAFLDAGDPPVYVGFGSMISVDPAAKARMVIDALLRAGVRGVIASGWGALKLKADDLPPSIFALTSAPHDWLFPRMAAVVHHGGSGTTATGLRAGIPSVIVPFLGDQHFWGRRVQSLGAGPAPISNKKLTADALTDAIRSAVNDAPLRANAARIGALLRAEDGIANAISFIERYSARDHH